MAAARKVKKTTSTKSSRRKPSAKRKKVSKPAKATRTTKATAKKKATAGKKSKPKPKSKSTRKSVDSILATFGKRRTEQQSKLAAVQKKIAQLEAKTKAYQAEIVSLKEAQSNAETAIGKIDLDRDQAVRTLLGKLGVKLVEEPAAKSSKKKPTKKKSKKSKATKAKRKAGKTRSRKKSSALESASQVEDGPGVIQATPLFDTVFRSQTPSNGNPPPAPEFPANSSSDELLDDESLDEDHY